MQKYLLKLFGRLAIFYSFCIHNLTNQRYVPLINFSTSNRCALTINRALYSILLLLFFTLSHAQEPLPDNLYDKFSPYYFGPNSFPIPEIHNGKVLDEIRIEIYNDTYFGEYYDEAFIPSIKLVFPLFSNRVNLSAWM